MQALSQNGCAPPPRRRTRCSTTCSTRCRRTCRDWRGPLRHVPHRGGVADGALHRVPGRPDADPRARASCAPGSRSARSVPAHQSKAGTPTMGGLLILLSLLISVLLWANLENRLVWIVVGVTVLYGMLGFIDDYQKVTKKRNEAGLSARAKLARAAADRARGGARDLHRSRLRRASSRCPFFKDFTPHIGVLYVPLAVVMIARLQQRREPDRRPRRPRDRPGDDRGRHLPAALVLVGQREDRRLPRDQVRRRQRPAPDLLRRAARRRPRVPVVQRVPGEALHGRRRLARARRRARHDRGADPAGDPARSSSAASS